MIENEMCCTFKHGMSSLLMCCRRQLLKGEASSSFLVFE